MGPTSQQADASSCHPGRHSRRQDRETRWPTPHNCSRTRQSRWLRATMGTMSASDAAPLPRLGEVFFDVRGNSRSMRLSWYADTGVAVLSIWQGGMCTGTFRLAIADLPRMVETLQRGPAGQRPEWDQGAVTPGAALADAPPYTMAQVRAMPPSGPAAGRPGRRTTRRGRPNTGRAEAAARRDRRTMRANCPEGPGRGRPSTSASRPGTAGPRPPGTGTRRATAPGHLTTWPTRRVTGPRHRTTWAARAGGRPRGGATGRTRSGRRIRPIARPGGRTTWRTRWGRRITGAARPATRPRCRTTARARPDMTIRSAPATASIHGIPGPAPPRHITVAAGPLPATTPSAPAILTSARPARWIIKTRRRLRITGPELPGRRPGMAPAELRPKTRRITRRPLPMKAGQSLRRNPSPTGARRAVAEPVARTLARRIGGFPRPIGNSNQS